MHRLTLDLVTRSTGYGWEVDAGCQHKCLWSSCMEPSLVSDHFNYRLLSSPPYPVMRNVVWPPCCTPGLACPIRAESAGLGNHA